MSNNTYTIIDNFKNNFKFSVKTESLAFNQTELESLQKKAIDYYHNTFNSVVVSAITTTHFALAIIELHGLGYKVLPKAPSLSSNKIMLRKSVNLLKQQEAEIRNIVTASYEKAVQTNIAAAKARITSELIANNKAKEMEAIAEQKAEESKLLQDLADKAFEDMLKEAV